MDRKDFGLLLLFLLMYLARLFTLYLVGNNHEQRSYHFTSRSIDQNFWEGRSHPASLLFLRKRKMYLLNRSKWRWKNNRPSDRSEEHTSELQSRFDLVCRLLLEKKK